MVKVFALHVADTGYMPVLSLATHSTLVALSLSTTGCGTKIKTNQKEKGK